MNSAEEQSVKPNTCECFVNFSKMIHIAASKYCLMLKFKETWGPLCLPVPPEDLQ
jgi:hypothetical protein